ncbi:hypothetical protein AK972_5204 [Pseudomonas yamanorum]|nr:hypothetical protein AK972_5204 [Pseudomonas yamanorum]
MQCLFFQVHRQRAVGGQAYVVVLQAVDKTHGAPGQRVIQRHDQQQRVVTKGQGLQAVGVHRIGNDPQVCRALAQGVGDAQARQFLQVDVEVGVLVQKVRQQFRQVFAQGGGVAQQAHLAFDAVGVFREVLPQVLGLLQQQAGMTGQGFARRCRGDATAATLQELDTQRGLHRSNPRTGRCQGQMAAAGAGGDVAGVEDVQVQAQVDQVKVHGLGFPSGLTGLIAGKPAPTVGMRSTVGAGLPAMTSSAS